MSTLSKKYRMVAYSISIVWLLSMVYLFGIRERVLSTSNIDLTKLGNISGLAAGSEEYLGVYFQDKKIGFVYNKTEKDSDRVIISHNSQLNISVQGFKKVVDIEGSAELDKNLLLNSFYFKMNADNQEFVVYGKSEDKRLKISSNLPNFKGMEIDNTTPIFLDVNLHRYIARKMFSKPKKLTFKVFSLEGFSTDNVEVEILGQERIQIMGEEIFAYHLKKRYKSFSIESWIDLNGKTLKEVSDMGFVLIRERPEDKNVKYAELDLISQFSITPDRIIPDIFSISELKVRLKGVELKEDINGGRQRLEGDILSIRDERTIEERTELSPEEIREYTKAELFIQSEDEEIKKIAKRITEGSSSNIEALERINEYLFSNIKKKNVVGIPDAISTLKNMEGDCNEHASLFVALARSLGIPTRLSGGVAYLNGRFYYHAWAEGYTGVWRTFDPTWGQSPADVGHIRLVYGGMERILDISRFINKLSIEVVEWK